MSLKIVQPRTLELYKILGILPDVLAVASAARPIRIYTSPEGPTHVAEAHMSEPLENTPEFPIVGLLAFLEARFNH